MNSYTYDAASNRTSLTAPDGSISTYGYDTRNQLNGLANSWVRSFGYSYDALSRRTQLTRPNGVNTNYSYDSLSHLLSVLHHAGVNTLDGGRYTYDPAGEPHGENELPERDCTKIHLRRALRADASNTRNELPRRSYSYDSVGNRLSTIRRAQLQLQCVERVDLRTQHSRLTPVRRWFRWLVRNNHILHNPASDLDLPRMERRLPKTILSADEVEHVMVVPDIKMPVGLRDRAMLETFYSTGLRRTELICLKLYDVDRERTTLTIRQGKGKKDRMIPIGERAWAWVEKYLREARPQLALEPDDATLFLTQYGEPFHPDAMSNLVRDYIAQANLGKSGACHTFRHTMATLMLEGGANLRYIQQMLGHAEISTTEIYTHVAIRKLQQIHAATHPGAKLERKNSAVTSDNGQGDEAQKAALLATLEAEGEEDE